MALHEEGAGELSKKTTARDAVAWTTQRPVSG